MFRTILCLAIVASLPIVKTAKASDTIYWSSKPTPDLLWELKTCELSYLDENFQLTMIVSRPSFLLILSGRDSLGVDGSALARIELPSGEKTKSAFIDVVSEKQISVEYPPETFEEFITEMKANDDPSAHISLIVGDKGFEAKWLGFDLITQTFDECLSKL